MNRLRKWLRRLGLVAVPLVAATLIVWVAAVPALVRRLAMAQLAQMGLPVANLEVRGLTLRCAQLANVTAGDDERFRIGTVAAHYTIGELLHKRLRTIEIVGLETEIRVRDGKLDLGPLADLRLGGTGPTPFERIEFRSCALRLALDGRVAVIPFNGHLANAGAAGLRLDLSVSIGGTDARLGGTVDTAAGEFALQVEGRSRSLPLPAPFEGTVVFAMQAARKEGTTQLAAHLSADRPVRLTRLPRPVSVGAFSAQAEAALDGRFQPRSANLEVQLRGISIEGLNLPPADSANLTARLADGTATLDVRAEGAGWRLEALSASLADIGKFLQEQEKPDSLEGKLGWKLIVPEPGRLPMAASLADNADLSGLGALECSGAGTIHIRPPAAGHAERWSWEVEAPGVRVALGKSAVAFGRFGAAISGLEAEARMAITANGHGLTGRFLPGSQLVVQSARASRAAGHIELAPGPEPALKLFMGKRGGSFSLAFERDGLSWKADIPEASVGVRQANAAFATGQVALGGRADIGISITSTPHESVVGLAPGSRLTLGGLQLKEAKLAPAPGKPLASVTLAGEGGKLTLSMAGGKTHWTAALSAVEAKAEAQRVEALGGRVRLSGPRLAARFNLDADDKLIVVNRTGPWELACDGAELVAGGHRLGIGPTSLEIAERGKSPLVAAGFEDGELVGGRLALEVRSTKPMEIKAGEEATGSVGTFAVGVEAKADGERRSAKAELTASGIRAKAIKKLEEGAASVELADGEAKATVSIPDERGGLVADFALGPATVKASAKGLVATLPRLALRGTLRAGALKAPQLDAELDIDGARVAHPSFGLDVGGVSATVPIAWNTRPGRSGLFRVGELRLGDTKLPGPWGAAEVDDGRLVATAAWEPLKGARLTTSASLGQEAGMMRGRLDFSLPLFTLEDEEALARLVPRARGLRATGTFGAEGTLRLEGTSLHPDVAVTILDGVFRSRKWEMDAEGVFATVRLDSLTPPLTPRKELQVALVKRAKMGKLEVEDGFVAFRLEPKRKDGKTVGWVAYLQRGEWGWVGGRLFTEKVSFDPKAPRYQFTVHARDLKLSKLLALIPGDRAAGVGAVSGQLPVAIEGWPNIKFGNGSLRTIPGQKGWIQIKDTEPLEAAIAQVARASVPRGVSEQVKAQIEKDIHARIIEALHDFEYDELKVDFIGEGGKLMARAFMRGRGRHGHKQEFGGVTLNFASGLDVLLRRAILITRKLRDRPGQLR